MRRRSSLTSDLMLQNSYSRKRCRWHGAELGVLDIFLGRLVLNWRGPRHLLTNHG
ncbi:hypothetical protein IF2G_07015 [Cordyceps javanica]|nr:hypothetical protein IF2G_07015 [Cordyceps javanica]